MQKRQLRDVSTERGRNKQKDVDIQSFEMRSNNAFILR